MNLIEKIQKELTDWVIEFHEDDDDKFDHAYVDYDYLGIHCEGPFKTDEDENGNFETDENLILYVLNADIYLADRISYIKKYKSTHQSLKDISFDKKIFPEKFNTYDSLCAWYNLKEGSVEFVPSLENESNNRFVKNFNSFLCEYALEEN